ncbi:MAG: winged helix-turn-helix transcriptional regulator, partial [Promethearchaeota archaeon]
SSAIKKRVKKLEDTGIIHQYRIQLSRAMTGSELLFGLLLTDGSQDEEEFVNQLGKHPQIIAAASYTGGHYALVAEYRNSQELWDVTSFLRSFKCVNAVETHQILSLQGSTISFSKLHLLVLNSLRDDPRRSIASIAEQTKLTARRVRRLVKELVEGKAVQFTVLLELGEAESIPFLMQITWDEKKLDHQTLITWLNNKFPLSLWETYISVDSPVLICLFTGENLNEVDSISRTTRRYEPVQTVTVLIAKHHNYFPGPRDQIMNSLLREAGLR